MGMSKWREYHLDEVYEFSSGLSKKASEFGSGFPFLSFKDVFYNYFVPKRLENLVNTTDKERERCSVNRGDVFLTRTSETLDELGMSCVALKDYPNASFNGFTKRLRPKENIEIYPEYAGYYFRSSKFRSAITSMSTMTTRASLNNDMLSALKITVPPLKEQKAIANILSSLDEKIELNNQMNKTLEEMAQALFKRWFVDFEFPNENGEPYKSSGGEMVESELGMIPEGWKVKGVDELVDSISKKHSFNKEKVIFLNTSDVLEGEVLHDIYSAVDGLPGQAKKSICKGDILYSEIRPKNKRFAYINFSAEDYVVSTKLMVLRAKGNIGSEMLYFYLTSDDTIDYLQMIAESRSGTFPQITFTELSRLKIAMPLEDVMEQMNSIFKSLLDKIQYNKKNNKWLTELRDTLLPKLMSGEIRVTDLQN